MKPKYRVGDIILMKNMPSRRRIILGIIDENYITKLERDSMFIDKDYEVNFHFSLIEEYYTLDLNHYIKGLKCSEETTT